MPFLASIGNGFTAAALAVLGVAAGFASLADDTPAPSDAGSGVVTVVAPATVELPESHDGDPGFNCATGGEDGNHICGPDNPDGIPAGCYDDGTLVVPWTRYDQPQADPLYGQETSPCAGQAPTQEQEADAAYAAAQVRTVAAASGGTCSEPAPTAPHPAATHTPAPQPQPQAGGLVNVNTASVAELKALDGIGKVLAARIVAQRPYSTVDDLHRVARLPFSKIAPRVTV